MRKLGKFKWAIKKESPATSEIKEKKRVVTKKVFNEFCDASTIHGLRYLGTRPAYEKYIFVFVLRLFVNNFICIPIEYVGFLSSVCLYIYVCSK